MKTLRDRRRAPTHPGAILREDVLPALRIRNRRLPIGWAFPVLR